MTSARLNLELKLQYGHGLGDLAPYFEALKEGRALARQCTYCNKVWFLPHMICPEDTKPCEWLQLNGKGTILGVTETYTRLPFTSTKQHNTFALVAMDGADNAALGRLAPNQKNASHGLRVRLVANNCATGHPAQMAVFERLENSA